MSGGRWRAYTDGSCDPNPGVGGWAVVLIGLGGTRQELCGGELDTTNNRMELTGILRAIEAVPEGEAATIYTDSQVSVRVLTRRWKAKKNRDLVEAVWRAAEVRHIEYRWIRGHNGNALNEAADGLANAARIRCL